MSAGLVRIEILDGHPAVIRQNLPEHPAELFGATDVYDQGATAHYRTAMDA